MAFRLKLTHKDGTPNRAVGRLRYNSTPRIGEVIKIQHAGRSVQAQVIDVGAGTPSESDYMIDKVHLVSIREIEAADE